MNKTSLERLYNGLIKENPTFVLMLGMCPTLAVTTSAINGMGMGLTTAVVLALSNLIISLLRKIIPSKVRIPAFIVIIASFVTVLQLLLEAYLPSLNEALGVYIPLIVVNCIILGRAEAYAYSNPPIPSLFDGIGMGLGFTVALTMIGAVREVLGAAKIFGIEIPGMVPIGIFVLAPGAFFVLATLTAAQNFIKIQGEKRGKDMSKIQSGCNEDCMNCGDKGCGKRFYDTEATEKVMSEGSAAEATKEVKVKVAKKENEIQFVDLDEEVKTESKAEPLVEAKAEPETVAEEVKPKRKPRTKTVKVDTEETTQEPKEETKAQIQKDVKNEPETEAKADAKANPEAETAVEAKAESEAVAEEVKPKRKPRTKTVKVDTEETTQEPKEELKAGAQEDVKAEPEAEAPTEVKAESEAVAEEVKPKRKPRKKSVKAETTETTETTETVENQEKEEKS